MTLPFRTLAGDVAADAVLHSGEGDRSCAETAQRGSAPERRAAVRERPALAGRFTRDKASAGTTEMNAAAIVIQAGFLIGLSLGLLVLL